MVDYAALALQSKMNPDVKSRLTHRQRQNRVAKELLWKQAQSGKVDVDRQHKIVEVVGLSIPGFFPTPPALARRMVEMAELSEATMTVLEPSVGIGSIADAIPSHHLLHVCELNYSLQKILTDKGYNLVGTDFLEYQPERKYADGDTKFDGYDRILMNPPFENHADIAHIQHAFELLAPRGKLVAIASEHSWFASHKADREFIHWFNMLGGQSEKLPAGTFLSSQRPTGVNTRIVTLYK